MNIHPEFFARQPAIPSRQRQSPGRYLPGLLCCLFFGEKTLLAILDDGFPGDDADKSTLVIHHRDEILLAGSMASQGTTPRRLTDLIGSLCDLTSGSGDKGTPIIHIQGYFDNYTN